MIVDNRGCMRTFVGPPSRLERSNSHLYLMLYIHYKKKENRTILSGNVYRLSSFEVHKHKEKQN